jgi:SAM-dependent methyltransferase
MQDDRSTGGYDRRNFVAEYYDFVPAYANRADQAFYLDLAASARGPILELGCGTGRLLVPIARAGCPIIGLDLSESMLSKCREKLAHEPAEVRARADVVKADMTDFSLPQRFKLAIAPFRCFQHLIKVEDQMACLRAVYRHLDAGCLLVLDLFNVDPARTYDPTFTEESVEFSGMALPDGRTLGRSSRIAAFHRAEQYNDIELIYYVDHANGRKERLVHEFPMRYFFRYEIEHLVARCGFAVKEIFGDYDRSPFRDASPEMIVMAEKRERT